MVVVTVLFRAHPGAEAAFLAAVRENAARSLAEEPGCRRFDVCTRAEEPGVVFLYELYDDAAAFDAHKTMPHYRAFSAATASLVAAKSVQTIGWRPRMPDHAIRREADRPRHARPGGASTVQMITPDAGARELINGFTDIPPGSAIALHFHNCEESVLVVSGEAVAEIDGAPHSARAGDVVWIAANVAHRFRNPSATQPLRIFWTYASAGATRTLVETGEERRVAVEHGA